jgi:hypothetical protein
LKLAREAAAAIDTRQSSSHAAIVPPRACAISPKSPTRAQVPRVGDGQARIARERQQLRSRESDARQSESPRDLTR